MKACKLVLLDAGWPTRATLICYLSHFHRFFNTRKRVRVAIGLRTAPSLAARREIWNQRQPGVTHTSAKIGTRRVFWQRSSSRMHAGHPCLHESAAQQRLPEPAEWSPSRWHISSTVVDLAAVLSFCRKSQQCGSKHRWLGMPEPHLYADMKSSSAQLLA